MFDMIETAHEFGKRFPDLHDADVFDHVEFVHDKSIRPGSIMARAVIMAYEGKLDEAHDFLVKMTSH